MASWTQRVVSTRAESVVPAWRRRSISPPVLLPLGGLFVIVDALDELGGDSFLAGASLDEIAHLLTTVLVLWAIGGALWERMLAPALVASVAIDLDHVPARLGADWLTAGTPRPYTHSLLTVVLVPTV